MNKTYDISSAWKKIKAKNGLTFIILGIAAGLVLLLLSFFTGDKKPSATESLFDKLAVTDSESYIDVLEEKMRGIIGRIDGVSNVSVVITLDSSSEYIYASKESNKESYSENSGGKSSSSDSQSDLIFFDDLDGSSYPILIKEIVPKIKGVAVVCTGGSDQTKLDIINLVSALLNLSTNRIFVLNTGS